MLKYFKKKKSGEIRCGKCGCSLIKHREIIYVISIILAVLIFDQHINEIQKEIKQQTSLIEDIDIQERIEAIADTIGAQTSKNHSSNSKGIKKIEDQLEIILQKLERMKK